MRPYTGLLPRECPPLASGSKSLHPHPQMHHAYESLSSGGRNGVEFGAKLEQRAQPGPMAASTQG